MEHLPRYAIGCHFVVHGAEVQIRNIVDGARIVDVVRGHLRCIRRSRWFGIRYLPAEVAGLQTATCWIFCCVKNLLTEVLVPDSGMKVVPCRVLRIGGWMERV